MCNFGCKHMSLLQLFNYVFSFNYVLPNVPFLYYRKPEVQDHQIQTDLTKDDIISHDDFVYKICK